MRVIGAVLFLLAGAAAPPNAPVALTNVYHSLDGQKLVIHGTVENRGTVPVGRLVIDVTGFAPSGNAAYGGSDGIRWGVPAGRDEGFSINLFLTGQLVREYLVRVSPGVSLSHSAFSWTRSPPPLIPTLSRASHSCPCLEWGHSFGAASIVKCIHPRLRPLWRFALLAVEYARPARVSKANTSTRRLLGFYAFHIAPSHLPGGALGFFGDRIETSSATASSS